MTKNQIASKGMFHHRDAGSANSASQCQLDGKPGGVTAGVQNASAGMCRFEPARELAIVLIEVNAEAHQIANARRTFGAKHFDGAGITQAGAGPQSIGDVLGDAVVREHRCGNAALGEAGVAVLKPRLGDQGDGVLAAEFERSDESGDAAANHDDVLHADITALFHCGRWPEAQHAFQCNACRDGNLLRYRNAVEHLPAGEGLQHPRDVAGVDAVHGRAGANHGVETEDLVLRVLIREPLHQVDLRSNGERAAGRSGGYGLGDVVCRARGVGRIDDRHGALRVHDDADVREAHAGRPGSGRR